MDDSNLNCADLIFALAPLARMVDEKPSHWLFTPDGEYESDHGSEWCSACGRAVLRHLRKKDKKRRADYILDGGWCTEHDVPPHCAGCGVKLIGTLLEYGGIQELAHFRENPPVQGNPTHAYEIREMLSALEYVDEKRVAFKIEAMEIAQRFITTPPKGETE